MDFVVFTESEFVDDDDDDDDEADEIDGDNELIEQEDDEDDEDEDEEDFGDMCDLLGVDVCVWRFGIDMVSSGFDNFLLFVTPGRYL